MSSWKVTYRDRTGAETVREVTADEMRRTAEWIDFIDRADESKAIESVVLWSVATTAVVEVVELTGEPDQ